MSAIKCIALLGASLLCLGGCTAIQVQPLTRAPAQLCIEENPKVEVDDFVTVLQEGFARHGIEARLQRSPSVSSCPYLVTYTARRSWDIVTYLSFAELSVLDEQRRTVATAHYHLRNKGGLSLMKWAGTRSKMEPVLAQLLGQVQIQPAAPVPLLPGASASDLSKDEQVKRLQEEQLSYPEYMNRYRQIMAQ